MKKFKSAFSYVSTLFLILSVVAMGPATVFAQEVQSEPVTDPVEVIEVVQDEVPTDDTTLAPSISNDEVPLDESAPEEETPSTEDSVKDEAHVDETALEAPSMMTALDESVAPVINTCPVPSAEGDIEFETVKPAKAGEQNLQAILDTNYPGLDAALDQTQIQSWNSEGAGNLNISAKFISRNAENNAVFGYYYNDTMDTFVPMFRTGTATPFTTVDLLSTGESRSTNAGSDSPIGFMIRTYNTGDVYQLRHATQKAINPSGVDKVLVYNPSPDTYILAFEDVGGGADNDYNDLVVELKLDCKKGGSSSADLQIEKTVDTHANNASGNPDVGINVTYSLVVTNHGPNTATGIVVHDSLPAGLTYVSESHSSNSSAYNSTTGDWVIGNLADGDTASLVIVAQINNDQAGNVITNMAGVTSNSDNVIDNNSDTVDFIVNKSEGGGNPFAQCSDKIDNDDDKLSDIEDPDCHTDGNASDSTTYNPDDNDESNVGDGEENTPIDNNNNSRKRSSSGRSSGSVLGASTEGQVLGEETTCGIYVDKFLKKGKTTNNTEAVMKVQKFLNDFTQAGLPVDGVYGAKTEAAVMKFQMSHKDKILVPWNLSTPTGIFYLTTQTEVNNIMCPTLNLPIPTNLIPYSKNPVTPKV